MSWKNSDIYNRTRGKSWWTRVTGFWNNLLNSDHDWIDYENARESIWNDGTAFKNTLNSIGSTLASAASTLNDPSQITSYVNSITGAHLTGSQVEANEMSMQNQEDIYQRQVAGMMKAGINPALMYQNGGASNAPAIQGQQGNSNMSDLMSALLLKKQSTLLDAQARKTDAETDKIGAETEYQKLVNEFYPDVTATQVDKMLMDMGVSETQIEKMKSEIDVNRLEAALKETQNIIEKAKSNESSAYYKAIRELAEADTAKAKEEKREIAVRAAMEELEQGFMDKYGAKMGSSEYIAIASAVAGLFGIDLNVFSKSPIRGLLESLGLIGNEKPSGAAIGGGSR